MDEFCRLRRNEEYGACPDEVHKCAFGILRLWNPAVTPSLRYSPYFSAIPLLLADGIALKEMP